MKVTAPKASVLRGPGVEIQVVQMLTLSTVCSTYSRAETPGAAGLRAFSATRRLQLWLSRASNVLSAAQALSLRLTFLYDTLSLSCARLFSAHSVRAKRVSPRPPGLTPPPSPQYFPWNAKTSVTPPEPRQLLMSGLPPVMSNEMPFVGRG